MKAEDPAIAASLQNLAGALELDPKGDKFAAAQKLLEKALADPCHQAADVPFAWLNGMNDMVLFSVRRGSWVIGQLDSLYGQPIEEGEWGARVSRVKPAPKLDQKSGEIAKLLGVERSSTQVTLEFSLVGLCHRIQPTFREGMSQINFTARTPIDAGRSRAIGWQARNYLRETEYDAERMAGILQAVKEDLWVVESVKPRLTPPSLSEEFLTETDGMELAFRKRVFKWAKQGYEIDQERFEQLSREHVVVIPSPARRAGSAPPLR